MPALLGSPTVNADGSINGYTYAPARLECAFGTSIVSLGTSKFTPDIDGNARGYYVGDYSDTWGLTPAVLNQGSFSLFVRRPTTGTEDAIKPRYLGGVVLTLYFNTSGGGSMAERTTVHQSAYFGKETTKGTAVATPNRFVSINLQPQMAAEVKELRGPGTKLAYDQVLQKEWCTLPGEGFPTYNEMGYLFASLIAQPQQGLIAGSSSASRAIFRTNALADDTTSAYTIIYGDAVRAHQVAYGQITELGINLTRSEGALTCNGLAQRMTDGATIPTGANEVQTMTITGIPTGGTFTLGFRGQVTTALNVISTGAPITAAALQTALQALPTIGAGNATVSGTFTGTTSITGGSLVITFASGLAGSNLPAITQVTNSMIGGTSPTSVFTETTRGGYTEVTPRPIFAGQVGVYLSTALATITSGKMTRVTATEIKFAGKGKDYWTMNDSVASFTGVVESALSVEIKIVAEADSVGMGMLTNMRAGSIVYAQIAASTVNQSITIDGTNPYQFILTGAFKVAGAMPFKDDGGVYATEFTLKSVYDPSTGLTPTVQLDTDVLSY